MTTLTLYCVWEQGESLLLVTSDVHDARDAMDPGDTMTEMQIPEPTS